MQRTRRDILLQLYRYRRLIGLWLSVMLIALGGHIVILIGWVLLYLVGLGAVMYLVERAAARIEVRRAVANRDGAWGFGPADLAFGSSSARLTRSWNPLDPGARYYRAGVFLVTFVVFVLLAGALLILSEPSRVGGLASFAQWLNKQINLPVAGAAAGILAIAALAAAAGQSSRLRQSLAMLATYSLLFIAAYFLIHYRSADASESRFDLPAGGGSASVKAQASAVKVQKRKKFLISPNSSVIFAEPPPIENAKVDLKADTAEVYKAGKGDGGLGDGEGDGGGFGGGTGTGKWRFIRLRHSDKNWDKNFGIGGDTNLLKYLANRDPRQRSKVADESDSYDYTKLKSFTDPKKSPPLIYIGGASFTPTADEKRILKKYLVENHGMILGDNLGGAGFHGNFIAVMREITERDPVEIPRDDLIHKSPFDLPQFPFVVAHARPVPLGWKIDGRWAVYYHPGSLSDAWRDDRAGIRKEIAELCYQLGINILFYAYRDYNRWITSQQP